MEWTREKLLNAKKALNSFPYFVENIFYLSFEGYSVPKHLVTWADQMQKNKFTARLSARKHLKTTLIQAYIMWKIFKSSKKDLEILYLSYKADIAQYHTRNLKEYIRRNPYFEDAKNLTPAESIMRYNWDGEHKIVVEPEGILSFKRGRHPDIVICDDILADPASLLNVSVVEKINRMFFEDVMSLPKEGGELHLVGTAQHPSDLFFQIRKKKRFEWYECTAIVDEKNKTVLWPENFPYDRLIQIRDDEIGEKAFRKEYMCSPVYSEECYLTRESILLVVNPEAKPATDIDPRERVIAGWDIGKHVHPSHIAVFIKGANGKLFMIFQMFMDNMAYKDQLDYIKGLVERMKIDEIYYDATRGELEGFMEQGIMDRRIFKPVIFKHTLKFAMAAELEKRVNAKTIELLNNSRMINQITTVNNDLQAIETSEGHGDAFWSIAMACYGASKIVSRPKIA